MILKRRHRWGRERDRERNRLPPIYNPTKGPNPQPRHVPWLGIKSWPFGLQDDVPIHWATLARACFGKRLTMAPQQLVLWQGSPKNSKETHHAQELQQKGLSDFCWEMAVYNHNKHVRTVKSKAFKGTTTYENRHLKEFYFGIKCQMNLPKEYLYNRTQVNSTLPQKGNLLSWLLTSQLRWPALELSVMGTILQVCIATFFTEHYFCEGLSIFK